MWGGNGRTVARRRDNRVKEDERGMKFLFLSRAFITSGVYFGGLSFPSASLPLSLFLTPCKSHRVNSVKKSKWFPRSNSSLLTRSVTSGDVKTMPWDISCKIYFLSWNLMENCSWFSASVQVLISAILQHSIGWELFSVSLQSPESPAVPDDNKASVHDQLLIIY